MPVLGQVNDTQTRQLMPVKDFRPGDVVEDTEPGDAGFRLVDYRIIRLVTAQGGMNGTLWTFTVQDVDTGEIMETRFTDLMWYKVIR